MARNDLDDLERRWANDHAYFWWRVRCVLVILAVVLAVLVVADVVTT